MPGFFKQTTWEPIPRPCISRRDAAYNRGLTVDSSAEEWGTLGPLAVETPADVRNRGAEARTRRIEGNNTRRRREANDRDDGTDRTPGGTGTRTVQGLDEGIPLAQEWAEAMHEVLEEMVREETSHDHTDHGQ